MKAIACTLVLGISLLAVVAAGAAGRAVPPEETVAANTRPSDEPRPAAETNQAAETSRPAETGPTVDDNSATADRGVSPAGSARPAENAATRSTDSASAAGVRFETVDLYVDTADQPLAAYQVSLHSAAGNALLAGLEGGEHPAFASPPYYDPKALIDEKVIVAAFSTADDLPRGRTRVARLHVQVSGTKDAEYVVNLQTAAGPEGNVIPAKVAVETTVR